ncbi:CRISPR-associated protein Cas4 [Paenibacillus athensensis]|uniref:CRISPR-associated exonuclease Cas4 n=1 Tax=Paenibacillus athensensis TaxID=1967502 RepID=A0A4Y8PX93_9BACL|nr:CRISPR-associated protein Cas4 [Paenibacillus athensensis]MCD1258068.1 CRISPR-associated protein Cas4 [Paenibacillus athensensis]
MAGPGGGVVASSEEDELLMLSGIQHYAFCRRQWGLIHLEQLWADNVLTYEGKLLHRRADDPAASELRGGVLISRAMPLVSPTLKLYGVADVVEFHKVDDQDDPNAVRLNGRRGRWRPYPVEYKRGNRKKGDCDEVQLCAQAIALEDMFGVYIEAGALYYGERERRIGVEFDAGLRTRVRELAAQMHEDFARGVTAAAVREPKCTSCSLEPMCHPGVTTMSAERYVAEQLRLADT